MKLTNLEKEKILEVVNSPSLSFEETKQKLTIIIKIVGLVFSIKEALKLREIAKKLKRK